jgi:hypothetical protein
VVTALTRKNRSRKDIKNELNTVGKDSESSLQQAYHVRNSMATIGTTSAHHNKHQHLSASTSINSSTSKSSRSSLPKSMHWSLWHSRLRRWQDRKWIDRHQFVNKIVSAAAKDTSRAKHCYTRSQSVHFWMIDRKPLQKLKALRVRGTISDPG